MPLILFIPPIGRGAGFSRSLEEGNRRSDALTAGKGA